MGITWLWVGILVLVIVAVVRLGTAPKLAPEPTVPYLPQATPTVPTTPPSALPSEPVPTGGFCTVYYVFSIDVTASWPGFQTSVSQGDASGAAALATRFHSEAQAMQQVGPPASLAPQINTVVVGLQAADDTLSTGSVADLAPVDGTWTDITALQAAATAVCG